MPWTLSSLTGVFETGMIGAKGDPSEVVDHNRCSAAGTACPRDLRRMGTIAARTTGRLLRIVSSRGLIGARVGQMDVVAMLSLFRLGMRAAAGILSSEEG